MFNVSIDEYGYFKNYAKVGKVAGGVDVETIPTDEDQLKNRAYKLISNTVDEVTKVAVIEKYIYVDEEVTLTDPETGEIIVDEETGEAITEVVQVIRVVTDEEIETEGIDLSIVYQRVKTDEDGNVVTQEIITPKTVYSWEFNEERYNELVAEAEAKQAELENSQNEVIDYQTRISDLEAQVEELKGTIEQMQATLNS